MFVFRRCFPKKKNSNEIENLENSKLVDLFQKESKNSAKGLKHNLYNEESYNIENLKEFFSDFENKLKELRSYVDLSYKKLNDQIREKYRFEYVAENLNIVREKLLGKVNRSMKSKLNQATSNVKALNDIYDLKFIENKEIKINFDYLIGMLINPIDKRNVVAKLKQLPFFKRINQFNPNLKTCLSKYNICDRSILSGAILSSQLIAIAVQFLDGDRKIILFDLSKACIVKGISLNAHHTNGSVTLTASKKHLIYFTSNLVTSDFNNRNRIIIFDNYLNMKLESRFKSAIYHACLTSNYILVSQYSYYPITSLNKYKIGHYDTKFSKIHKSPIDAYYPKFDAINSYLVYARYDKKTSKCVLVLHDHKNLLTQFDSIIQFQDFYFHNAQFIFLNSSYLLILTSDLFSVINVSNGQRVFQIPTKNIFIQTGNLVRQQFNISNLTNHNSIGLYERVTGEVYFI
jgi:hypothetical protein